jgi:prepilin-type N-terminal cleavage/methylation domain-containing protein
MTHQQSMPSRTKGFTLIELLVVMAIISLLAAMLFPVFARARENARRASCMSNVKQLALGLMMYSQDYDEKFPFVRYPQNGTKTWDDQIFPYIKSDQVFMCPSAYYKNTRAYAMNVWIAGWTNYPFSGITASETPVNLTLAGIPNAANTVLLIEDSARENSAGTYNLRGQVTESVNPGGVAWTTRSSAPWGAYTGLNRRADGVQIYGPGTGVHINDTFVTAYADGHVKVVKAIRPPADGSFLWSPY